jgi:CheY-like chemotaxis protein
MRRYLLVDDNVAFAENLAEILRDSGAEAQVATHGQRALELAATQRFDALVTDMRMPLMNGARLVHEIRQLDPGLPAIVVTAYTGENDLQAAREEGLLAVLPKPAPIERLMELLGHARRDALVALVEDDMALADNLAEALRERGFSAVNARTVTETERLGQVRPFAALVDLRLPGGPDGEAMRRLSRARPGLPMFVITGHPDAIDKPAPDAVFVKPFDTGALLASLEQSWATRKR